MESGAVEERSSRFISRIAHYPNDKVVVAVRVARRKSSSADKESTPRNREPRTLDTRFLHTCSYNQFVSGGVVSVHDPELVWKRKE